MSTISLKNTRLGWTEMLYGFAVVVYVLFVFGLCASPSDAPAWILMLLMYAVIAADEDVRHRPGLLLTLWAVLLAHEAIAVIDIYGPTVVGADTDAASFSYYADNRGVADMEIAISLNLYRNFLIIVHTLYDGSRLLLTATSTFAFTLTLLIVNRLLILIGVQRLRPFVLLLFGLLPNVLVFTSITLREPWQLLFFTGAVYYGLCVRLRPGATHAVLFILCSVCLGLLHQVLIPFTLVLIAVIMLWPITPRSTSKLLISVAVTCVIVAGLTTAVLNVMDPEKTRGAYVVIKMAALDGEDFLRQIGGYRKIIEGDRPRSSFDVNVDTSSFVALAASLPKLYAHYLFAPFPWHIENAKDLAAALLSLLRLGLIAVVLIGLCRQRDTRNTTALLLTVYLLMCSTWFLGSTNYGQAIRHNVLSDWLLLAAAGLVLERALASYHTKHGDSRHREERSDAAT